jgi:MarR family transcriptional regulator, temperature-dependent positive regulator of motility
MQATCVLCAGNLRICQAGGVNEGSVDEVTAMAQAVKRAREALIEGVRRGLASDGLRGVHTQVFEHLDPGGTRLTTLAERARMSHQAMGEMVDELIRHRYLERVPDPADGRARLIRPTARGRAELIRAAGELRRLHDRWQSELQDVTVAQVVAALRTLIRVCAEEPDQGLSRKSRTTAGNRAEPKTL